MRNAISKIGLQLDETWLDYNDRVSDRATLSVEDVIYEEFLFELESVIDKYSKAYAERSAFYSRMKNPLNLAAGPMPGTAIPECNWRSSFEQDRQILEYTSNTIANSRKMISRVNNNFANYRFS